MSPVSDRRRTYGFRRAGNNRRDKEYCPCGDILRPVYVHTLHDGYPCHYRMENRLRAVCADDDRAVCIPPYGGNRLVFRRSGDAVNPLGGVNK